MAFFGRVYGRFRARRLAYNGKIGRHEREIAYEILLWDSPILMMGAAKKVFHGTSKVTKLHCTESYNISDCREFFYIARPVVF